PQPDEFLRESLHGLRLESGPPSVDPDVTALRPAELLETLSERGDAKLCFRIALGKAHQYTDPPHPVRLLRARRERPRRRAAEQRDERATFHSITSSARSKNGSGILRPSALAVVRLMTSSNFVGCSTGMSAGFAPRKILST